MDLAFKQRLENADRGGRTVAERTEGPQRDALVEEGLRHARAIASMMGGLDEEWTMAFAQAWLYGFQMGHDYVQVYGACLEEDRLPWGNATGG